MKNSQTHKHREQNQGFQRAEGERKGTRGLVKEPRVSVVEDE
jgi:hypothetical protein